MPPPAAGEAEWERTLRRRPPAGGGAHLRSRSAGGPWDTREVRQAAATAGRAAALPALHALDAHDADMRLLKDAVARCTEFCTLVEQGCRAELAAAARHIGSQQQQISALQLRVGMLEEQLGGGKSAARRQGKRDGPERTLRGIVADLYEEVRRATERVEALERARQGAEEAARGHEAEALRRQGDVRRMEEELARLRDGVSQQSQALFSHKLEALRDRSGAEDGAPLPGGAAAGLSSFDGRIDTLSRAFSARLQEVTAHLLQEQTERSALEQRFEYHLQQCAGEVQACAERSLGECDALRDRLDRGLRCCRSAVAALAQSLEVACPSFSDALPCGSSRSFAATGPHGGGSPLH
eukprot:TRINITY_DN20320_c0_g1_i2.p1 TRINITY_DN20320_c0_g1~~TRINITY_DN20320_c0_g1_i2.p1  ORF type:complete len:395 (+),score=145.47 TRINITY_DN20320_c0_g1_i2:126-1187(+)